jgi:acyl carrier protein
LRPTRQEIQTYILNTIGELSRDWDYPESIGEDTLLFSQLGLESLEAVVLATSIQEYYRQLMPFAELFAKLGQAQRDLSVAELVRFIDEHLVGVRTTSSVSE